MVLSYSETSPRISPSPSVPISEDPEEEEIETTERADVVFYLEGVATKSGAGMDDTEGVDSGSAVTLTNKSTPAETPVVTSHQTEISIKEDLPTTKVLLQATDTVNTGE